MEVVQNAFVGNYKEGMKRPIVIDGRNIYDKEDVESEGFIYKAIGK